MAGAAAGRHIVLQAWRKSLGLGGMQKGDEGDETNEERGERGERVGEGGRWEGLGGTLRGSRCAVVVLHWAGGGGGGRRRLGWGFARQSDGVT